MPKTPPKIAARITESLGAFAVEPLSDTGPWEVKPGGVKVAQFPEGCVFGIGFAVEPVIEGRESGGTVEIQSGRYNAAHSLETAAFMQIVIPRGTPADGEDYIRYHNTTTCVQLFTLDATAIGGGCLPLGTPCGGGSSSGSGSSGAMAPLTVSVPKDAHARPLGAATEGRAGFQA